MTKILFLAYYFPPLGGAGVQRTVKFLKYLPLYGYEPVVVTGPGIENDRWSPVDETLTCGISASTAVYRVRQPLPKSNSFIKKIQKWLSIENAFSGWWYSNCVSIIEKIIKTEKIKLLYISMSPFEGARVGDYFGRKYKLPWVADLRDPWVIDEMQIYPTFVQRRREKLRMRRLLASASGYIMNTPEAGLRLRQEFPDFAQKQIVTIPNGFDAEDFLSNPNRLKRDKFRIVHTGYLHTELGLTLRKRRLIYRTTGGVASNIDILTRSHIFLLQAIENWLIKEPGISENVELVLAGKLSDVDRSHVKNSKIVEMVEMPGYIPHTESISLIQQADLLFLPMHNLPEGERATIVPGKTYEYMAAGVPILAAVPEGDAKELIQKSGTGIVCKPDDVQGMMSIIDRAFQASLKEEKIVRRDSNYVAKFERKNLTRKLGVFFDSFV